MSKTTTNASTKASTKSGAPSHVKEVLSKLNKASERTRQYVIERHNAEKEKDEADELWKQVESLSKEERQELADGLKSKKRARNPKPKDQPSQGRTGYNIFQTEELRKFKEANPDVEHGDAMKKVGEKWNSMTEEQKAPFNAESAAEKARQKPLVEAYAKKHPELFDASGKRHPQNDSEDASTPKSNGKGRKKKGKKDPNAPKRNINRYMYFQTDARKKGLFFVDHPKKAGTQIFDKKACGAAWDALVEAEKLAIKEGKPVSKDIKKFTDLAAADKTRYEEAKAAYLANKPNASEVVEEVEDAQAEQVEEDESSSVSSSVSDSSEE